MAGLHLSYLGLVTIYQDGSKSEASAALFADEHGWFGHYYGAAPDGVASGPALLRFHDASEAEAELAAVDPERGGFRLSAVPRKLRKQ